MTAQATDSAGNSAASQPINLTVVGPVITSPTNGQSFQGQPSIVVSATATSTTGSIAEVRYFDNGSPLGNVMQSPFNYNWNNVPGGQHTLTAIAIAIDSSGNSLTGAPVTFTVEAPLSVMLTSPSAGTMTNDNFALSASVTEAAGTITQVSYYDGTNLLGTATQAPYGLVFKDITPKTYVLTAQATDSFGRTVTSSAVTVTVVARSVRGRRNLIWQNRRAQRMGSRQIPISGVNLRRIGLLDVEIEQN